MHSTHSNRITTIDALRGFALFGILYAHIVLWFSAGALPEQMYKDNFGVALGFYFIFILGKFFSIFSFLFGLSFYIQIQSLLKRNDNVVMRFGWRLFILGIIGFIHHILWRGDILTIYVPLGFLLIFARNLSDRVIFIVGIILIFNLPTKIYQIFYLLSHNEMPFKATNTAENAAHYYEIISSAPFMSVILDNLKAFTTKFDYQISSGRLLITFGFFLLGMYAGRMQWFEKLDSLKDLVLFIWKKAGITLLAIIIIGALLMGISFALGLQNSPSAWGMWVGELLADIVNATLTVFYITSFILLSYREKWKAAFSPLADVGKMALTSYLTQTIFGLLLFYSFGLGLFAKTTTNTNALICIAIFALQIIFSRWWLQRFYYGLIEWLWRSATLLKFQKMVRTAN